MGILTLPCRYDYWRRSKWLLRTSFNSVMARDRFSNIWRYPHIEDNKGERANTGKLWKLRWLLDHLKSQFQMAMTPSSNVAIDESIIKFKGRRATRIDQMEFTAALIIYKMKWPETMCNLCHTVIDTVRPFSR